jgi:broad specificity phosphatase PhoE
VQGCGVDSSINDFGQVQALCFFEMYRRIPFDKIYTSSLKRSIESVQAFIRLGIPHEALSGLNEISWGVKEGHRITPEEDAYYHWMLSQWQQGNTHHRIEGGESPEDVSLRQGAAINYILSKPQEQTILICMHGRAMRILLCRLLNYPLRCMDMFEHENLCLYELHFTGSIFSVHRYNDTHHLKPINDHHLDKSAEKVITI